MDAVYRSVLAVVEPGPEPDPAFARAVAEAQAAHARLTLLCPVPPPSPFVCLASISGEALHREALGAAECSLRRLADGLPPDLPVTTMLSPLPWARAVRREVARGGHDVVVIGAARAWWRPAFVRPLARRCGAAVLRAPSGAPLAGAA